MIEQERNSRCADRDGKERCEGKPKSEKASAAARGNCFCDEFEEHDTAESCAAGKQAVIKNGKREEHRRRCTSAGRGNGNRRERKERYAAYPPADSIERELFRHVDHEGSRDKLRQIPSYGFKLRNDADQRARMGQM